MALTSPRRSALADQVITELRNQITSGEWPVGSRIPTEPELVEQLGVARNTVREAVRALAHNGLLDIRQGSGTYVIATSELAGVMHRRFADADPRHIAELRSTWSPRRPGWPPSGVPNGTCGSWTRCSRGARRRGPRATRSSLSARTRRCIWPWSPPRTTTYSSGSTPTSATCCATGCATDVGQELRPEDHMDHGRLIEAIRAQDAQTAAAEAAGYSFKCLGDRVR